MCVCAFECLNACAYSCVHMCRVHMCRCNDAGEL